MQVFVDFSTPTWLIVYYYVMGVISIILNSFGIYLLIVQCRKLGKFRYLLLSYQTICFVTDVHLTFLMQPVPLYPLLAGYSVGVLSNWFGVPFHYLMLIIAFLAVFQLDWLVLCFLEKHQAVALIIETHRLSKVCVRSFYIFLLAFPLVFGVFFQTLHLSNDQQWNYILTTYPEHIKDFQKLDYYFAIYHFTPLFYTMCIFSIIGGFLIISALFLLIVDIFWMMRKLKIRMSKCAYRKHHDALRSLIVQLGAAYCCLFPACFLIIVVVLEMAHVQLISELFIVWLAAHSSVNVISLMIFFPPFRRFFRV